MADALDRLGLAGRRHQLAGELSGGWKQRLALAACILHQPRLLLLDEPTAGVDPQARREFWTEIHALAADGLTVLVSTHYMDEAERCHQIAYLAYGRRMAQGSVEAVIAGSGLVTYALSGPGVDAAAAVLAGQPGVAMVTPFGARLHVSGTDPVALKAALEAAVEGLALPGLRVAVVEPTLEDVFIHLMCAATDNFASS